MELKPRIIFKYVKEKGVVTKEVIFRKRRTLYQSSLDISFEKLINFKFTFLALRRSNKKK